MKKLIYLAIFLVFLFSIGTATAAENITIGKAVDNTNLKWTTNGTGTVVGQNNVTHDGVDATRLGSLAFFWNF